MYNYQQPQAILYTNKILVASLAEALGRVVVPNADYVFFCREEDCYFNIRTDPYGNKSYLIYKLEAVTAPSDLENRIKKLEDKVYGPRVNTGIDANYATSTDNQQSPAVYGANDQKQSIGCSTNSDLTLNGSKT